MTTNAKIPTYVRVMNDIATRGTTTISGAVTVTSGTVEVSNFPATQPVSGTVTASAITTPPADRTDAIFTGSTSLTPKFAVISESAADGTNELVAAVSAKKIRVVSLYLVTTLANVVTFLSATGGTAKSGAMPLPATAIFVLPYNPVGWFETISGEGLFMSLTVASLVAGGLTYVEV